MNVFVILTSLFSFHVLALSQPVVITKESVNELKFGNKAIVYSDVSGVDADEILSGRMNHLFSPPKSEAINLGSNKPYPHWVMFKFDNRTDQVKTIYIEHAYSATDYLRFVALHDSKVVYDKTLGDHVPFADRDVAYRNPVFAVTLNPGLTTFYGRLQTTSAVRFVLRAWTEQAFRDYKLVEYVFVGFLFGGILVMGAYNLFLCITLRSRTYLLYCAYIASYIGFATGYYGFTYLFVDEQSTNYFLNSWDLYTFIDLISITALAFSLDFLELKKRFKSMYYVLLGISAAAVCNLLANAFSQGAFGFLPPSPWAS